MIFGRTDLGFWWWLGVAAGAVVCLALGPTFGVAVFLGGVALAVLCALVHVGRTPEERS